MILSIEVSLFLISSFLIRSKLSEIILTNLSIIGRSSFFFSRLDTIISKLDNGYHINIDESSKLKDYDNTVFAFMSPNDISKLEDDLIKELENKK